MTITVWTDEDHLGRLRDEGVPYAVDCSIRRFLKTAICGRKNFEDEDGLRNALEGWGRFLAHNNVRHQRDTRYRERLAQYWLGSRLMLTQADEVALYMRRRDRDEASVIVVAEVEGLPERAPARVPPLQRFLPFARSA